MPTYLIRAWLDHAEHAARTDDQLRWRFDCAMKGRAQQLRYDGAAARMVHLGNTH